MKDSVLSYEVIGSAAVVTLNRPERRNALSRDLITALAEAFRRAQDDAAVRSVIVTGAGTAFCAGMDLAELQETLDAGEQKDIVWEDALRLARLFDQIYSLPKPTIAAVNGSAAAGGAGLVSVCDLAIAVPGAKLGYPEVRRGLVAAMVMPHLLRHVGERTARWLLLTGEMIDAADAVRTGLLNAMAAPHELLPRALEWAAALAAGGPQALATTKALLHRFSRQSLSVEEAARASAEPRLSDECQHGLRAFFAKQPVPWTS